MVILGIFLFIGAVIIGYYSHKFFDSHEVRIRNFVEKKLNVVISIKYDLKGGESW